jgi:hypothetical protein
MKKKSHSRAPDKRNFSVALPVALIEQIEAIAKDETRSRNRQIEHFLQESVKLAKQNQKRIHADSRLSVCNEDEGNASSRFTPASGVRPISYRANRNRKKA